MELSIEGQPLLGSMPDELFKDQLLKAAFGFHDALVAYAYALLRDHALAEDAVQSAYVVITRKADSFSADKSVIAWCRGVVRLEVLQLLRKTGRELATEDVLLYDSVADSFEQVQTPSQQVERGERRSHLEWCLKKLPERSRELVAGRYVEELGLPGLAGRMKMSEAAVRKSLYRIRLTLRHCIENELPNP